MELALNNGKDTRTGKQVGPQTGEAEAFGSYGELHDAARKQLQYFVALGLENGILGDHIAGEVIPYVFASALVDDCIKKGADMNMGGARYSMDGSGPVGMIDLADSLAAVKKLVYDEKRVGMRQLLDALAANFDGYEEIRLMLLRCPKYGNNDNYVDSMAREWYDIFFEEHQKFRNHLGDEMRPYAAGITRQGPYGAKVGALPSGRKAGESLADGSVSASPGRDTRGPTALVHSASWVIDCSNYCSNLLNVKLSPSTLRGNEGLKKLVAFIITYMDLGGHHVQFNVVSYDTLRDAQLHPENYRSLLVRVAGFSAFFIHLNKAVQDQIMKRSELSLD